jgi:hypothetical protein
MLRAQQARSGGQSVADLFEDEALLTALMRRDAPQEGAVQELASAPIERAFESILTDEVFGQMPRRMGDQMGQLGRAMAETLDHLSPERAERVIKHAILDLQKEHPRAWSKKAPLLTYLCQNQSETLQAKKQRLIVGLRRDVADGFDALTVMVLMRSCFLGLKGAGLDLIIAPWLRQADQVYGKSILEYKGKSQANHLGEYPKDAVVGITGLGQNSPVHAEDLTPALRANNRGVPDLNKEEIAAAVMFGNPFVSGPSGTTNMFLHAVSYFNEKGTTNIDGSALTTLLATLLCYDGGHSIHEVFSVAHLLSSLPKSQLSTFLGYTSGHARGLYVDLAEQAGSVNVSGKALKRLYAHFHDEEVRPKTLLQF